MGRPCRLIAVFLLSLFVIGCATGGKDNTPSRTAMIETVSVTPFKCSDPAVSQNVQNIIIGQLLSDYSIIIGQDADAEVQGEISLTSEGIISSINAKVLNGSIIIGTASVLRDNPDESHDSISEKLGAKIKHILSNDN